MPVAASPQLCFPPALAHNAELAGARQKDREVNERTFHTWMNVSLFRDTHFRLMVAAGVNAGSALTTLARR